MQNSSTQTIATANKSQPGVVYRTVCQNPGCEHTFDLRITPQTASKLFGAKLVYRLTGVAPRPDEEDAYTDATELRY